MPFRLTSARSFFVDVLSSFFTNVKFTRHELQEYVAPVCEAESTTSASNPASHAVELAHALAFRNGLGLPLYASAHSHISVEDVKQFASSVFAKDNVAVLGTGISQEALSKLVEQTLGSLASSGSLSNSSSAYFGGETRVDSHEGPQTVFIGFGQSGAVSPELAVSNKAEIETHAATGNPSALELGLRKRIKDPQICKHDCIWSTGNSSQYDTLLKAAWLSED